MSIRNILVAFDGTPTAERAAKLASVVAIQHDAHVTGIFAHSLAISYAPYDQYMSADAIAIMQANEREAETQIKAKFMALVKGEGVAERASFLRVSGYPNDIISEHARTYDLTVVGQPAEDSQTGRHQPNPDEIALQSGRPVLIAPRCFETFAVGAGAVLAWDGKRAAARALSDAMDLIEAKNTVTVLHVGEEGDVRRPGRDIMEHLSRHGLTSTLSVQPKGSMRVSDIVLNTCAETDAGLLVMGAYEHSKFSEMLLGGVTRDVLARTHIPVLMSH